MNQGCCAKYSASKGFSLLEVMVAMIIMSLSLTLLYQSVASSTNNSRVADEYVRALMLAESVLAANTFVTEPNLRLSDSHDKFDWEVLVWPVRETDMTRQGTTLDNLPDLHFLSVKVFWASRDTRREVDLLSIVPLQVGAE